ncbi:MAG: ATP-binding protein [Acidimicrobiales bacterium]
MEAGLERETPGDATSGASGRLPSSLRPRFNFAIVAVALVPVVLVGALAALLTGRLAEPGAGGPTITAVAAEREERARLTADAVARLFHERLADAADVADEDAVTAAVTATYEEVDEIADWPTSLVDSRFAPTHVLDSSGATARFLQRHIDADPGLTTFVLTEANGFTVAASTTTDRFANGDEGWWQGAWTAGAHVGPVIGDGDDAHVLLAVRVDSPSGPPAGVLTARLDTAHVQQLVDGASDDGASIDVTVVGPDDVIVAETGSDHDGSRIGTTDTLAGAVAEAVAAASAGPPGPGSVVVDDTVVGFARVSLGDGGASGGGSIVVVSQPLTAALAPFGSDGGQSGAARSLSRWLWLLTALVGLVAAGSAVAAARTSERRLALPLIPRRDGDDHRLDDDGHPPAPGDAGGGAVWRNQDVAAVLLDLGRRNQQLIGRQLRYIEELERSESDPDTLAHLFALDQMATRLRRNAESLLVLAGEESPRRGSVARPVEDVVRAAAGEVEDYARVELGEFDPLHFRPHVIGDLTHLVAELIENAANFSPPTSRVIVSGYRNGGVYTLTVHDEGVGMSPAQFAEANGRIADPATMTAGSTPFLGLFVVGRLAARHGVIVHLDAGPDGSGVTATVALPTTCEAAITSPADDAIGSRVPPLRPATGAAVPTADAGPAPAGRGSPPPLHRRPAPTQPVGAGVGTPIEAGFTGDDETSGLPIPPFRARESKIGGGPRTDGFSVRRRVRRASLPAPSRPGAATDGRSNGPAAGIARAEDVRDTLIRFTGAVAAARRSAEMSPAPGDAAAVVDPERPAPTGAVPAGTNDLAGPPVPDARFGREEV